MGSQHAKINGEDKVPLLTRAWVFQERFLAPRTVHFHPFEMVMECKSSLCCEREGLDNIAPQCSLRSFGLVSLHTPEVFKAWHSVVEDYSRLQLTKQSDGLAALIGVAATFQFRLQCRYLAGI